jgi:hypothetical protein
VRNALIVLVVVALVMVALGAVNNDLLFNIDYVAGTWTAVSLFWVAVVTAGIVVVTGLVAVYLAASGSIRVRRMLERELQSTYERLRATEAMVPRPAPAPAAVADVVPPGQTAATSTVPAASVAEQTKDAEAADPDAGTPGTSESESRTAVAPAATEAQTSVTPAQTDPQTAALAAPDEATALTAAAPSGATDAGTVDQVADVPDDAGHADAEVAPPPGAP